MVNDGTSTWSCGGEARTPHSECACVRECARIHQTHARLLPERCTARGESLQVREDTQHGMVFSDARQSADLVGAADGTRDLKTRARLERRRRQKRYGYFG